MIYILPILIFLIVSISVIVKYKRGKADKGTLILALSGFGTLCGLIIYLMIENII